MSEMMTLEVTGMKCGSCEANVEKKLQALAGVIKVKAYHKDDEIEVEFERDKTNREAIEAVITKAGYKVLA
ncbi:MAG: heavy-metal-associated domain-containing protein [Methylococcales bacterium]|nr:heavy-metal-associated domain-containing protein [Methylococcales bacterium]